jgi:D-3-phosphoglycerate dehydrogenase / 2-oxoglutarate reductase
MDSFKVALVAIDAPEVPDWVGQQLKAQGIVLVAHDSLTAAEFLAHARDANLVWVYGGNSFVSAKSLAPLLPQLERCGAILRTGSGTDNIPVEVATELGIVVANTPEAHADNVADHAIGLLFAVTRQIAVQNRLVREGIWDRMRGWPNWHFTGQTLGIVGFGHIGQLVARKMRGFELKILVHDPVVNDAVVRKAGAHPSTLDDLLQQADFVSLHCPLIKSTHHLIDERALRLMKKTAVLINTSRGPVIDEKALARALTEGWIAAAGLDVLETEPPLPDNPLLKLANTVITPHIAGYSDVFHQNFWAYSVQVILDFAAGHWPRWIVNREVKSRWALTPRGQQERTVE